MKLIGERRRARDIGKSEDNLSPIVIPIALMEDANACFHPEYRGNLEMELFRGKSYLKTLQLITEKTYQIFNSGRRDENDEFSTAWKRLNKNENIESFCKPMDEEAALDFFRKEGIKKFTASTFIKGIEDSELIQGATFNDVYKNMAGTQEDFFIRPPIEALPIPRNKHFVGRDDELKKIEYFFNEGRIDKQRYIVISAGAGIGKTQLALEYAYRSEHKYKAICWVKAEKKESIEASFRNIAKFICISPQLPSDITLKLIKDTLESSPQYSFYF